MKYTPSNKINPVLKVQGKQCWTKINKRNNHIKISIWTEEYFKELTISFILSFFWISKLIYSSKHWDNKFIYTGTISVCILYRWDLFQRQTNKCCIEFEPFCYLQKCIFIIFFNMRIMQNVLDSLKVIFQQISFISYGFLFNLDCS